MHQYYFYINRIIDNPPKSRNEKLASLMRTLRICEELGTGWDKIVIACELMQLPAPKIEIYEDSTKVTLYSHNNKKSRQQPHVIYYYVTIGDF